jgi:pimeloyl-ACP methyl ester carboxylesterase
MRGRCRGAGQSTSAERDLLGFSDIAAPALEALDREKLDPITVGIVGWWGSGKSTILKVIERELRERGEGPAPFRGVLPLPFSALNTGLPVLGNRLNRHRAVPLTYDQFRYSFANAVSEDEAKALYETYSVPGPGEPLFQAAAANLNPWSEAKVDAKNPDRGPLLIISAEADHTVPWAIANASYKKEQKNPGVTEIVKMQGRGHALTIDNGWQEVAETSPS